MSLHFRELSSIYVIVGFTLELKKYISKPKYIGVNNNQKQKNGHEKN